METDLDPQAFPEINRSTIQALLIREATYKNVFSSRLPIDAQELDEVLVQNLYGCRGFYIYPPQRQQTIRLTNMARKME